LEQSFKDFRREILKATNKDTTGVILRYEEAEDEIREYLHDKISEELSDDIKTGKNENIKKDKEYLKKKQDKYRELIQEAIGIKEIKVKGYEGKKINDFIEEMVGEFAGWSILEDARKDPEVSDIYVIKYDTIFVEKAGKNMKYPKTFRNPKHYEDVVKRLVDEAEGNKTINSGDSKIVDFEIYQDRGNAISPEVSPKGYSLTIRKHPKNHVTREQLISQNIMDERISDLLGTLIMGETNIICAGITGSGKTTTIRALLDYYVAKANKRMIVCEDTQELFLQNEHTLELVTVKSDEPKTAVSLKDLIVTALRLKPKYIVIGEVRGVEAEAAVEGMETGHSVILTMHGGNVWNIVNRLVTKYLMVMPTLGIDVVERIIGSAVDYIFIQDDIPGIGRKITSLNEINYDFNSRRVTSKTIFGYDFKDKTWVWKNGLGRDKVDKMLRRGISLEKLVPLMDEESKKTMKIA